MAKKTITTTTKKRSSKKHVDKGQVHILVSFNNTLVTVTDINGNALTSCSAGALGFRGSRKSTPYAAQQACEKALKTATDIGMKTVEVYIKGPGPGRDSAIRAIELAGLKVSLIADVNGIAHNGCRPPKRRRI